MTTSRMSFVLDGRDQLSRVFDRAGDAATRMSRRITAASINSDAAIRRFADSSVRSLADLDSSAYSGSKAVEALKGAALSLAPAAIPMAAALAPIAAGAGAATIAIAAFGAALGPQISALGDAAEAEQEYTEAVEENGARSKEATKAQADYAKTMARLPPAAREAAAAVSVLKDEYKEWSDSLSEDTLTPVIKGTAVLSGLFPKLTPVVKGASTELDRLITLAAGGVQSPGLDSFMGRVEEFTTGTLRRANDALIHFMRTADGGQVAGGLSEFMDFARVQGPLVADTLKSVATALLNVLEAGADVGVGMLTVINALAGLVAAVPPGAITALLQLAIAIKAVQIAAIGLAAGRAALAAFGTTILAMRAAAAGTTGTMAALTASFGALSRGAKLALVGSGIGILVLALSQLSQIGRQAPADVDKMTSSIKMLGKTGMLSGEAARVLGADLGELETSLRTLSRPSNYEGAIQWIGELVGIDSAPVGVAKEQIGALDDALSNLVRSGNPELAEAAIRNVAAGMEHLTEDELRTHLTNYKETLKDVEFEQRLAAESMGLFGQQALQTKQKLDAQKMGAEGLRQAIHALNQAHLMARGGIRGMEAAIDAASEAFKKNGQTLNENTAAGRANNQALDDLASSTMKAVEAKYEETGSWSEAMKVYDRGRGQLVAVATQMKGNEKAAKSLADQILRTPNKTAMLKGNIEDLEAKLRTAKDKLSKVPDGRKAKVRAEISQLENQVQRAKNLLDGIPDEQVGVSVYLKASSWDRNANGIPDAVEARAQGGLVGFPGGGPVRGPGTSTSDSILTRLSNGEFVVRAAAVQQYGIPFLDDVNQGRLGTAEAPRPQTPALMPAPGRAAGPTVRTAVVNNHFTINGALDPVGVGKEVERVLLKLQRTSGN
ncbi:hypothetical protein ACFU51_05010 [Streptomyces sp. NPDC057430]|uniref:hypothetical protein n=1 Tax=Streptomyces sp. NPDC057430 TaxID=3346131 RepID=UPI0036C9BEA8